MNENQKKRLVWIGVALSLVALMFILLDWNILRPAISKAAQHATGREFTINGDLNLDLLPRLHVRMDDVHLSNATWSEHTQMASAAYIDFALSWRELFSGKIKLTHLELGRPTVLLEESEKKEGNWILNQASQQAGAQSSPVVIDELTIRDGSVTATLPSFSADITAKIDSLQHDQAEKYSIKIEGKGTYKSLAVTLSGQLGDLLDLTQENQAFPINLTFATDKTRLHAKGTLLNPLNLKGEKLDFSLQGKDLAELYPLLGIPIPPTSAYKLSGSLDHVDGKWSLKKFRGAVGKSDLQGDFTMDTNPTPKMITAELVSHNLDMADLSGFIGARSEGVSGPKPPPPDKILPADPIDLEKLRSADADVKFRADRFITEQRTPLERMQAHLIVKDGNLKLSPLNFSIAAGELESQIQMNIQNDVIHTHADILAKGMQLEKLVVTENLSAVSEGTLGGRAKLDMKGNSVANMLGTADGEAALIMDGGNISELVLRLSNLDIANSLARLVGGDKETRINCFIGNMNAKNGRFEIQEAVLDTTKVHVKAQGHINMSQESMNLRLESKAKDFSLASLRGPVDIGGTFKSPELRPALDEVATRGGLAVALGSVTAGLAALIPLLDLGEEVPSNCAGLIEATKKDADVRDQDVKKNSGQKNKRNTR